MLRVVLPRARLLGRLRPSLETQRLATLRSLAPRRIPALHCRALCSSPGPPTVKKEAERTAGPPVRWTPQWAWELTRETVLHYWHGTKLLAADTKIASQLLMRMLRGRTLSRREHNLLVRVLADLLRVIPLAFFVLVPFMEFALPFAIRLFPNLLPSTFEEGHVREEKRMRLLKVRLRVAQVLEHTLEERAKDVSRQAKAKAEADLATPHGSALELRDFMRRIREGGEAVTREETLKMMALFKDHLTLDVMTRRQLVSLCEFLGLRAFAPDPVLRFQLRTKLRQLRNDDKDIMWEGVESLSSEELRAALRARGMPTRNLDDKQMQDVLREWVQLSQNQEIPSCLLLLSNVFRFARVRDYQEVSGQPVKVLGPGEGVPALPKPTLRADPVLDHNAARTALSSISEGIIDSAIAESKEALSPKEALAALERERLLVEEERKLKKEYAEKREVQAAEEAIADAFAKEAQEVADGATSAAAVEAEVVARLSREQVREIAHAVGTLSAKSALEEERNEMSALEAERLSAATSIEAAKLQTYQVRMLDSRVRRMMETLKTEIEEADGSVGATFKSLDLDGDGVLSREELMQAIEAMNEKRRPQAEQMKQVLEQLDPDSDGKIQLSDLRTLMFEMELRDVEDDLIRKQQAEAGTETGTNN